MRLAVAAPRRHPHARSRRRTCCAAVAQRGEAVRESGVKSPQRRRIVPSVIEEERIERDAALLDAAPSPNAFDDGERIGFVVFARSSRCRTTSCSAETCDTDAPAHARCSARKSRRIWPGRVDSDDRAELQRRAGTKWKRSRHAAAHTIAFDTVVRERMLEREVRVRRLRSAFRAPSRRHPHLRAEVEHGDFAQRDFGAERAQHDFLADVARSVAQYSAPHCLDPAGCILQRHRYLTSGGSLSQARRLGSRVNISVRGGDVMRISLACNVVLSANVRENAWAGTGRAILFKLSVNRAGRRAPPVVVHTAVIALLPSVISSAAMAEPAGSDVVC